MRTSFRPTVVRSLLALSVVPALAVTAAPTAGAGAAPGSVPSAAGYSICSPGEYYYSVSRPAVSHGITHATILERYTGGRTTRTVKSRSVNSFEANVFGSASLSTGAGAKVFGLLKAEAKQEFHIEVAARFAKTSTEVRKVKDTLPGNDTYVFYAGKNRYTSSWRQSQCDSSGRKYVVRRTGTVSSWAVDVDGAVGCYRQSPPARSMASSVQKKYC